jgi:hypothetical protein
MNPLSKLLLGSDESRLFASQRTTHQYVIGQPGTGKSRMLEACAMQDIREGRGVTVMDPHGDLFYGLLARVAQLPKSVWQRVVIIDPCDPKWVVSFNPLDADDRVSLERLALFLTDIVIKIWGLDVASAPRLVWLLTNSFLALADLGLTLLDLPRFLLDTAFRNQLLPQLTHERVRAYFTQEFPRRDGTIHQWVAPVLNKISGLIFDADLRLMLAGGSTLNFRTVLDRKLVVLVHLPKGILGERPSALVAAFVVAQIQKAALARADSRWRPPHYLYLDEFQNYTTDNIQDILSESRKYNLSLTLAHQYLDQLSPELKSAVLSTTGTLCCFRVGYGDAFQLAKDIFPSPDFLTEIKTTLRIRRVSRVPFPFPFEQEQPLGWEGLAQVLSGQPTRQFWMRRRELERPTKLRTLDVPDLELTNDLKARVRALRDVSGERYGRLKRVVAREVGNEPDPLRATTRNDHSGIPMWGV